MRLGFKKTARDTDRKENLMLCPLMNRLLVSVLFALDIAIFPLKNSAFSHTLCSEL